ncbi:ash family protein [Pseudomonas sp. MAFF 301380]|uniref:Ash family protein n=1 Tax=Pseudomonas lactucae TaxID=2813360 RepID=A0A9X0YDW8_9PSED|nr:ash family protein [Pseudomonas lactucae]MBN2985779.1 ash family protein [Pseudomonas lactucae]
MRLCAIVRFQLALFYRLLCGYMVAVRGIPSGMPGSLVTGPRTCVQLPPSIASRRSVAAPLTNGTSQ